MAQPPYQPSPGGNQHRRRTESGSYETGVVNHRHDPDWNIHTERQEQRRALRLAGIDPTNATKSNLVGAYRKLLTQRRPWALEPGKLDAFMDAVWKTLNGGNFIDRSSDTWGDALVEVGLPRITTLRFLHNLPHGE